MRLHFRQSYYNRIAHFRDLEDEKIQVGRDFRNGKIFTSLSLTNVSIHFKMT